MPKTQAKTLRFNENDRPSTAATSVTKSQLGMQKSHIPKFRSLSQPPSVSTMSTTPPDIDSMLQEPLPEDMKNSLLESDMFNDPNLITDEFKDCLESVKLELDTTSTTDLTLGDKTAAEILNHLNTPENLAKVAGKEQGTSSGVVTKRSSAPIRTLLRKNSNSGIPISMSLSSKTAGARISTRSIPRRAPVTGTKRSTPSSTTTTLLQKQEKKEQDKPGTSTSPMLKRNLDIFLAKKKRYDTLRKDIQDKQKPISELYSSLQQLKKKLADIGKQVTVDPMPFENHSLPATSERQSIEKHSVHVEATEVMPRADLSMLKHMKQSVEEIRLNTVELCKNMMEKRAELLMVFENMVREIDGSDNEQLMPALETHREENAALDASLMKMLSEQEVELQDMVSRLTQLTAEQTSSLQFDATAEESDRFNELHDCQGKIQTLEEQLVIAQKELTVLQEVSREGQACGDALRNENDKLKQKISSLEKQIEIEKKRASVEVDKVMKSTELNTKNLKLKIKELENAKLQNEGKIAHLQQDLRSAQNKVKVNEKNYEKEIAELNKSRNLDRTVIESLNKDKSTIETRLNIANQLNDTLQTDFETKEQQLRLNFEDVCRERDAKVSIVQEMKYELEKLSHELGQIERRSKHSIMSSGSKEKDDNRSTTSEKECELQIEVLAQRVAIKGLQEKVEAYNQEKKKFVETIDQLKKDKSDVNGEVMSTFVQKEEQIRHLQFVLKKKEEELNNSRIECHNLKMNVEMLSDQIKDMKREDECDLQRNIKEGRSKLEEALRKSLDNEHKIAKYEVELIQKCQRVKELENTLKVRDGLIGLLKTKKEELIRENQSLEEYATEIRKFVIEANEELKQKTEIIAKMQVALNEKIHELHEYEKHMSHLEEQIASTNQKRYKLQDSVNILEGRLSQTYGVSNNPRYDETATPAILLNGHQPGGSEPFGLMPWTVASLQMYNEYKAAYINQKFRGASMSHSVGSIGKVSSRVPSYTQSEEALSPTARASRFILGDCEYYIDGNYLQGNDFYCSEQGYCPLQQMVLTPEQFASTPENQVFGAGQVYQPMTFGSVESYEVAESGHLAWFTPTSTMQSNNAIITRDLLEQAGYSVKKSA